MNVQALLCDAATVRENLLHVLGAGVTRLWRDEFPARLGVDLGLLLTLHPLEADDPHNLRIVIQTADGAEVAKLEAEVVIEASAAQIHPGERFVFPLAVPLRDVAVEEPGQYGAEILVDNQHVESLFFAVESRPELAAAPDED